MFPNFCFSGAKNVSATNVSLARKRGSTKRNRFPQQCYQLIRARTLLEYVKKFHCHQTFKQQLKVVFKNVGYCIRIFVIVTNLHI